jgi:hypothetical protein
VSYGKSQWRIGISKVSDDDLSVVKIAGVERNRNPLLLKIAERGSRFGRVASLGEDREKNGSENGNDCDHD